MSYLDAHVERSGSHDRAPLPQVAALAGVVAAVDVEADRVTAHAGFAENDVLEVAAHFTSTWWELLNALLPVLEDTMSVGWTPGRWWACGGGEHAAVGRGGRAVMVSSEAGGPFLAAAAGSGMVEGVKVW